MTHGLHFIFPRTISEIEIKVKKIDTKIKIETDSIDDSVFEGTVFTEKRHSLTVKR